MASLLGPKNFPYFSEAIAEIIAARLFYLQIFCGLLALVHLMAERLYFSKSARQLWLGPLLAVWALSLFSGAWLRPKINDLHVRQSAVNLSAQQREAAAESFNAWQKVAWVANLSVVAGVAVYLWRVANPPDPARFVSAATFRH